MAALLGFPTKTRFPQDRIGNLFKIMDPVFPSLLKIFTSYSLPALDVSQSIGAAAGLETDGDWPAAVSKTLARQIICL